eukprot:3849544-Amphidinium_carterae.1
MAGLISHAANEAKSSKIEVLFEMSTQAQSSTSSTSNLFTEPDRKVDAPLPFFAPLLAARMPGVASFLLQQSVPQGRPD